jgi:hypothetical protein
MPVMDLLTLLSSICCHLLLLPCHVSLTLQICCTGGHLDARLHHILMYRTGRCLSALSMGERTIRAGTS